MCSSTIWRLASGASAASSASFPYSSSRYFISRSSIGFAGRRTALGILDRARLEPGAVSGGTGLEGRTAASASASPDPLPDRSSVATALFGCVQCQLIAVDGPLVRAERPSGGAVVSAQPRMAESADSIRRHPDRGVDANHPGLHVVLVDDARSLRFEMPPTDPVEHELPLSGRRRARA